MKIKIYEFLKKKNNTHIRNVNYGAKEQYLYIKYYKMLYNFKCYLLLYYVRINLNYPGSV